MMLDKKQIQVIFLFMFKMGHKAVETTCNINNAFGPGTTNKQCSGHSRNIGKEMRTLKMRSTVVSHQRAIIEADSLTTTWEVDKELSVNHSTVIQHLKQIGKVRKLDKLVPHELTKHQKNQCFEESSSLILCNNKEPSLHLIVTCDEKWILYDSQWWPAQ